MHGKITSSKVPILEKFLNQVESGKEGMFYTERPKSTSGTFDFLQNVTQTYRRYTPRDTKWDMDDTACAILRLSYATRCKLENRILKRQMQKKGSFFFIKILEMLFKLLHLANSINYDDTCVELMVHWNLSNSSKLYWFFFYCIFHQYFFKFITFTE